MTALLVAGMATFFASAAEPFPLVANHRAAAIWFDAADHTVVAIAANDLATDIERVTGVRPELRSVDSPRTGVPGSVREGADLPVNVAGAQERSALVLIGTLGRSALIDALVAAGRIDVGEVRGRWETFLIGTVDDPLPGVRQALVIAGSDRRGTAFGVYELSQQIGVSPWSWWADVPPRQREELLIPAGTRRVGPPSVQYRGIFINDEDWGMQPWAAHTLAPEDGGIGPKTYRKIFELLLRLKANTLWPAMHACTRPFNAFPENRQLADDHAIVMGSSHAEPMLRNNVGEWKAPHPEYNYVANRRGVLRYWEERMATNGRYENIYTIGMRGIHDSGIQGTRSDEERIRVLEQVFADQRALIAKHVRPEVEEVPQMFCAYKEVLDLYRKGLRVPDDVTIVWPDDNFGFIRSFASATERERSGGFGVYYHLSYLGRPLAYLWLGTTPPALVWEEMRKAWEHGARKIWIVNVGDLKPAEIGTELFLQTAWDIDRWNRDNLPEFLPEWAAREFGPGHAREIAALMKEWYQLNFQRRPEHLQWWLQGERVRTHPFTVAELGERLRAFRRLEAEAARIAAQLSPKQREAYFQLVEYPVVAAAQANRIALGADEYSRRWDSDNASARAFGRMAREASARLHELTRFFDEDLSGGKWRHFMNLEPADNQWRSMRMAPWVLPAASMVWGASTRIPELEAEGDETSGSVGVSPGGGPPSSRGEALFVEMAGVVSLEAEHFSRARAGRVGAGLGAAPGRDREIPAAASWQVIPGLGRTGPGSVGVFPTTASALAPARIESDAPVLEYDIDFAAGGDRTLTAYLVPTHPIAGGVLRFAIGLGDAPPHVVELDFQDGSPDWAEGVLANTRIVTAPLRVPSAGRQVLRIQMVEAGVVIDKVVIHRAGLPLGYLGPAETRTTAATKN